ncbi:uncharacterized protein LOC112467079 [Temnothorax curvispinosus]|uniref:Uncharacterized protein LOC112467079 n=1 Tax=Temnothorax curvispinosus TaxID=300111 RepID=A0A6J1R8F8_9HYME|nr:uncharacterized protein LOC112467079 [Temnothorax curvispinosus]
MSHYYRVKKYRELRKGYMSMNESKDYEKEKSTNNEASSSIYTISNGEIIDADNLSNKSGCNESQLNIISNEASTSNYTVNNEENIDQLSNVSDSVRALLNDSPTSQTPINKKIKQWTLQNLDTLRLNVVSELLLILREEGHTSLPQTAQTLLGTKHSRVLQVMFSNRETEGAYMYLGIQNGLEKIISLDAYSENEIPVFIHIDGMQIYQNSQFQVWPISVKICHPKYDCKPFVAGIFCGDSKPRSSNDYLHDFVEEAKHLINNGIELHGTRYFFKINAIIADSPARAFIKCCKPPNSFFACERCTTKGISVRKKRSVKRVYPEMNSRKRSKESFLQKKQPEHRKENVESALLQLPDFNVINSIVIDSMHLLYCGVMKFLLEKWIVKTNVAGLKKQQVCYLKDLMTSITPDIPCEFQRKKFDINAIPR